MCRFTKSFVAHVDVERSLKCAYDTPHVCGSDAPRVSINTELNIAAATAATAERARLHLRNAPASSIHSSQLKRAAVKFNR